MRKKVKRNFGTKLFIGLLFPIIISGLCSVSFAQQFTIEDFHAEIIINEDATIDVTEVITVQFERPKHGIYREIPCRYEDELGDELVMPISVNSVKDENGRSRPSLIEYKSNFVSIRIGDADRYVDGQQIYVISYQVDNTILFFDDHDELYWNVTGDLWRAPIIKSSATVTLNTDKPNSKLTGACYTGRHGSTASACNFETSDKTAYFATEIPLDIDEGFTIALGWDKEIVAPPSDYQQLLWKSNLAENWVFIIPIVIFIFLCLRWIFSGRDPKVREAVAVLYEPPKYNNEPLTPAQVGALVDESFDQRDITSSIINLAVKGFIELQEYSKDKGDLSGSISEFTIKKLKESDQTLNKFEATLLDGLFSDDSNQTPVSKLNNRFYRKLPKLKEIMFNELINRRYFTINPAKIRGLYNTTGFLTILFGVIVFNFVLPDSPIKGMIAAALSGTIIMAFSKAMPAKTKTGALAKVGILGFREFLNRADKDRIQRMGKDLFYKYLPYAIALDVTDNWIDSFADILTEPPKWYVGHNNSMIFNSTSFSKSINDTAAHIGSTVFSAPRGSGLSRRGGFSGRGGSSGGSSGGGGGGGGGGSW